MAHLKKYIWCNLQKEMSGSCRLLTGFVVGNMRVCLHMQFWIKFCCTISHNRE